MAAVEGSLLGELEGWYWKVAERYAKDLVGENPVIILVKKDGEVRGIALKSGRHAISASHERAKLAYTIIKRIANILGSPDKVVRANPPDMGRLMKAYAEILRRGAAGEEPFAKIYEAARRFIKVGHKPRPNTFWDIVKEIRENKNYELLDDLLRAFEAVAGKYGINVDALKEYITTGESSYLKQALGETQLEFEFYTNVDTPKAAIVSTVIDNVAGEPIKGRKVRCSPEKHEDCKCEGRYCWRFKKPEEVADEIIRRVAYALASGSAVMIKGVFDGAKLTIASKSVEHEKRWGVSRKRIFKSVNRKVGKTIAKEAEKYKVHKAEFSVEQLIKHLEPVKAEIVRIVESAVEAEAI